MSAAAIHAYLKAVAAIHGGGDSTEHSFRGDLRELMRALLPGVRITNEPRPIACGAPDFVLARDVIPLGYIEAKDLGKSLDNPTGREREQFERYLQSLDNIIFTNYLEFRFYRDGDAEPVSRVSIAELIDGKIKPSPGDFEAFIESVKNFGAYEGQTITTADDLAARMADKSRLLAGVIESALNEDETNGNGRSSELHGQLAAFRELLDAGIKPNRFAGIYAQTIAYGMFVARLHDPNLASFSRDRAARLIPGSNPFLKNFFGYIAAFDLDARIKWIVDDLADIFRAADVAELMKDFGKATQRTDPFIHFYETFLGAYDSKLRKGRGVYYTPAPAVNFIVRAVDSILKTEFKLPGGIADTAKTTVTVDGNTREMHKVQILDPGTGTGTFLADIVKFIHDEFRGQHGTVKRDAPVMVVIGNPPYAVSSSNRGRWIQNLIEDYKDGLNEKKLNLDDDYIKFIRFGEHLVEKTGEGILAYISNNSFVDGITHRRMRERLLETFDRIYILNLHGDSRKQERAPDGSKDQNVFDIMQGVSINLFVKSNKKKAGAHAEVFHRDLFGVRDAKYEFLWGHALGRVKFNKLHPRAPYFFWG